LHLTGELRGAGRVYQPPDGKTQFELNSEIADARATPHGGAYTLDPVAGRLTIEKHRLLIHELRGRRGDAAITLGGNVDWSTEPVRLSLTFEGDDLPIERELLDLIPREYRQRDTLDAMFQRYRPAGVVDATLTYTRGETDEYRLAVRPTS